MQQMLFPKEFEGFSDREIFELLIKANQFEEFDEEFEPDFLYLPKVDNSIWKNHRFELYETTDCYHSFFYVKNSKITFLLEDMTQTEDDVDRSYRFVFHSVDLEYFFRTIDEVTNYLIDKFPLLKTQVSTRDFNRR